MNKWRLEIEDYNSKKCSNHVLVPVGYGMYLKVVHYNSQVRSAYEQFEIHTYASDFKSHLLHIPKPYRLVDEFSYLMEHVYEADVFDYKENRALIEELLKFTSFMIDLGYFPYGYSVLRTVKNKFYLVDFSRFGSIDKGNVRFKHTVLDDEKIEIII